MNDIGLQIPLLIPATAKGIIDLLDYYNIDVSGRNVTIIGRSDTVGKPLQSLLLKKDATITVFHSKTSISYLKNYCLNSDIIISAAGKPNLITKDMVKDDTIIIDVGFSIVDNKFVGDCDFDNLIEKCVVSKSLGIITTRELILNLILSKKYLEKGVLKNNLGF